MRRRPVPLAIPTRRQAARTPIPSTMHPRNWTRLAMGNTFMRNNLCLLDSVVKSLRDFIFNDMDPSRSGPRDMGRAGRVNDWLLELPRGTADRGRKTFLVPS